MYNIEKVLQNGKECFYRLAPNVSVFEEYGPVSTQSAALPNSYCLRFTQDKYLEELAPSSHKIFNKNIYPDKWVTEKDEQGNVTGKRCEYITRIAVNFQRIIASKQKIHLTGKPIKFTLTNINPTDEDNKTFVSLKQGWLDHNMGIAFSECVESQLTTGDAAIYLFREDGILDWQTFSFSKGDYLIPIYKDNGKLKILYRLFKTKNDEAKDVEAVNVFDEKQVHLYIKDNNDWQLVYSKEHGFPEVPCQYIRCKVAWDDVQNLIEEFEWAFSSFCESNAYFANTILFAKGDITMLPQKSAQGKVIQGNTDSDVKYLTKPAGEAAAIKLQFDTLTNLIFKGGFYVDITPENIKSSGDMPGVAVRLLMTPEIDHAIELSHQWDDFVDGLWRLFRYGYGLETKMLTSVQSLRTRAEIDIYTPENSTEIVNILNQSVSMKTLSKKTASEKHPFADNDETKRLFSEIESEETEPVQNGMNEYNQQQQILNQ